MIADTIQKLKQIYEEHYKKLMLIPLAFLLIFVGVLVYQQATTGDFVEKDVSLQGGVLITVSTSESISADAAESTISDALDTGVRVTELSSIGAGGRIGYSFELASGVDKDAAVTEIGNLFDAELTEDDFTVEEISPSLGASFWASTIKAILIAFAFMAIVVFAYFRKLAPSLAIIFAAVSDFIGVLAIMNIAGIRLSSAGVAALLMLIGYSVDSDVLLSTKVLKRREGKLMSRIYGAMKTGLTMEVTTLAALIVLYIIAPASSLKTISLVLVIGILLDIPNTWLMNAGILKWYVKRKERKGGSI